MAQRKETIMKYRRTQYAGDKERGVFRVMGISFENSADDKKIQEAINEVSNMNTVPAALMTKEALCRNIKAPNYILERLESMPIGSSFEYNGLKITRWGEVIYNGRTIL